MLAAGALCVAGVFAGRADSQNASMPGQVVGNSMSYSVNPVGTEITKAAPNAGKAINMPLDNPMMRRYDATRPLDVFKGTGLSASQVIAPVHGVGDQSSFHQLFDKLKSVVSFSKPTFTGEQHSGYFPSLTRRNHERAEARLWRQD
jgi:hypothetical protein